MKSEILAFLSSHKIIRELEEKTAITLDDLLTGKIHAAIPTDADLEHSRVSPEFWGVAYSTEITQNEHDKFRAAFRGNGAIIQDAAMLVAAMTQPGLSKRQKEELHKGTQIADHNHRRRQEDGHRKKQSEIAKKERNAEFNKIVERLAAKKHPSGELMRPAELWDDLAGELNGYRESVTDKLEPQYIYDLDGTERTISKRAFTNKLSKIRKTWSL